MLKQFMMLGLLAGAGAAQASVVSFTDRALFDAATTGQAVDTFGNAPGSTYVGGAPYVRDGFTMTVNDIYLFNVNPSVTTYYYDWGTGNVMLTRQFGVLTITFDAPTTAFGFDLGTFADDGDPSTPAGQPSTLYSFPVFVGTAQGNFTVDTFDIPNLAFFGLTSSTPFSSVTITSGDNFTIIDNVTLATANAGVIPEPGTWALMIAGFGLVGASMRRRKGARALA